MFTQLVEIMTPNGPYSLGFVGGGQNIGPQSMEYAW